MTKTEQYKMIEEIEQDLDMLTEMALSCGCNTLSYTTFMAQSKMLRARIMIHISNLMETPTDE